ncbi:MAG: hypothetical protein FJ088_07725, partial [Deltaproteobacteria bacterium]|nr:hypothetical protein [Deltaproteobacteria bacterium]
LQDASQKKIILFQRGATVVFGLLAFLLLTQFKTVLDMAFTAYTMIGAGLTPCIVASFVWKKASPAGGIASIAAGFLGTIASKIAFDHYGISTEYIIFPPLILSISLLVILSYFSKSGSKGL